MTADRLNIADAPVVGFSRRITDPVGAPRAGRATLIVKRRGLITLQEGWNDILPAASRAVAAAIAGDRPAAVVTQAGWGDGIGGVSLTNPVFRPLESRQSLIVDFNGASCWAARFTAKLEIGAAVGRSFRQIALLSGDGQTCSIKTTGLVEVDDETELGLSWDWIF